MPLLVYLWNRLRMEYDHYMVYVLLVVMTYMLVEHVRLQRLLFLLHRQCFIASYG